MPSSNDTEAVARTDAAEVTARRGESGRHAKPRAVPVWLRVALAAALILVWTALAGIGGPYFGKVGEVATNDQASYLPASAEATQVQQALVDFRGDSTVPAIVLFTSGTAFTDAQRETLTTLLQDATSIPGIAQGVSPLLPSEDGLALQAFVPVETDEAVGEVVAELRAVLESGVPAGVQQYVTGPAGFTSDLIAAFAGIDGLLLLVALGAVFLILIVVYRSLLLPIAVLSTSLFALCVALLTVWWLAKAEVLLLSGQTQGILFILVIGAATDYALLYVARFREALRSTESRWDAVLSAWKGSVEPILASGGTVIAGLLCLLLSDLASNKALGPVASIGIGFAMLSALTLLPALMFAFGRAAFWPRRPRFEPEVVAAEGGMPSGGWWAGVARFVRRRPRLVWIATTAVLLLGAVGITQLQAGGVSSSELVLGQSEARDGQVALGEHFPGGSGVPVTVLTDEGKLQSTADALLRVDGILSVSVLSEESVSGSAPVTAEGIRPVGPPGTPVPAPTVADGRVVLQATMEYAADSAEAEAIVLEVRELLAGDSALSDALVGGVTAIAVDTNEASIHDRTLIIPIILVVILLILMLLLRSILAPILLVATTVLSFGTAMGVSALVFNHLFGFPGADPAVPLFGFVFLVALGIDYNIFLMTRVREESLLHGTHDGISRGLAITGGVITSAGVVLAATFAALAVIPILFLLQLAFIVAFGVLLDTFIVRTLLVPGLGHELGRAIWWPSKLSRLSKAEPITLAQQSAVK